MKRVIITFLCLLCIVQAYSQSFTISGTIIDGESNEPLIGAGILVKGAGRGTITNIDGKYSLEVKRGETLVFSFVGYQNQEVAITKECGFRPVTADSFSKRFGDSCFLIRIGRHSGAEAVTIEGNRNIKIMQGYREPPKYSRYGSTTIWLASETARPTANNGLTPFGWAVLEIVPFDAGKGLFATVRKEFKSPSPSETINESSSSVQEIGRAHV